MIVNVIASIVAMLVMPFVLFGVVNRVKSLWSGRKGPRILQSVADVIRLLRKTSVYSHTTTPLFRIAPWVYLVTAVLGAACVPLVGSAALVSFPFDFIFVAYAYGLGRVMIMLAALDTGSPFEGMGAAREALFACVVEPALILVLGALVHLHHEQSLAGALIAPGGGSQAWVVVAAAVLALFVMLQVEGARMPVDDPQTHLELTMIHEVMVLDHSGPDLAAIQYGTALKMFAGSSLMAALLNPFAGDGTPLTIGIHLLLCVLIAILVGTVESLIARFKIKVVPHYIGVAVGFGAIALLATSWREVA